ILADSARLSQVLWNLIQNAAKFTPPFGEVKVRVTNPEQGWLRVEVTDTGIGIGREVLPRIFDAFEQVEPGRSGGLGLGLAISKAIVELHGGRISANSEGAQRGSTFVVELPTIVRESAGVGKPDGEGKVFSAPDRYQSASKRPQILLVEDHHD